MDNLGINPDAVEPLVARLVLFATQLVRRLNWRGARISSGGVVPAGYEPQDFVADAFAKAMDGTRAWNHEAYPTAEQFLQSIIKSDVNHLATSLDNTLGRRLPARHGGDGEPDEVYDLPGHEPRPVQIIVDRESVAEYRATIISALENDRALLEIFRCYEAEVTEPAEIATRLGWPIVQVYNAKKRLRRKLADVDAQRRQNPQLGAATHE